AVTVFVSAVVDASVPVTTPFASVVEADCAMVLLVPDAEKITVCPASGLPFASSTVTVIVAVLVPFAGVEPELAVKVEAVALGERTHASNVPSDVVSTVALVPVTLVGVRTVICPLGPMRSTLTWPGEAP